MCKDETADLFAEFNYQGTVVSFSVDNSTVAFVSGNGVIKATTPGSVIITVGSALSGVIATCVVTVATPTYEEIVASLADVT